MLGKMVSLGFDLATLPARMTLKGAKAMVAVPGDIDHFLREIRQASDEVAREIQLLLDSVDAEMREKAAHLSPVQKQQAAELALGAAEQHLSMAAVNMLRALWLTLDSSRSLEQRREGVIIEHDS
jgi:predicted exporter